MSVVVFNQLFRLELRKGQRGGEKGALNVIPYTLLHRVRIVHLINIMCKRIIQFYYPPKNMCLTYSMMDRRQTKSPIPPPFSQQRTRLQNRWLANFYPQASGNEMKIVLAHQRAHMVNRLGLNPLYGKITQLSITITSNRS